LKLVFNDSSLQITQKLGCAILTKTANNRQYCFIPISGPARRGLSATKAKAGVFSDKEWQ
jgi:hypothetical protein